MQAKHWLAMLTFCPFFFWSFPVGISHRKGKVTVYYLIHFFHGLVNNVNQFKILSHFGFGEFCNQMKNIKVFFNTGQKISLWNILIFWCFFNHISKFLSQLINPQEYIFFSSTKWHWVSNVQWFRSSCKIFWGDLSSPKKSAPRTLVKISSSWQKSKSSFLSIKW